MARCSSGAAANDGFRQAETFESSVVALTKRIDEIKSKYEKLESENAFLQGYVTVLAGHIFKQ